MVNAITKDIYLIDAHYYQSQIAAIYLIRQGNKIAIVDTGTQYSLPYIKKALSLLGLSFEDVLFIMPTHVHLDHAAGAGVLMKACQHAQLVIHPRGARHMIDPEKLIAGTIAVYGEEKFNQLYGDIVPIDKNRVIEADDEFCLDFNKRSLIFLDTPGHAKHHFCIWDKTSKTLFSGDTFGVSYREFDKGDELMIFPTTTPIQFEPDVLLKSIDRLYDYHAEQICLTHFGAIKPTKQIVNQLKEGVNYFKDLVEKYSQYDDSLNKIEDAMMAYLIVLAKRINPSINEDFCRIKLLNDVNLNAQGLLYWQEHKA